MNSSMYLCPSCNKLYKAGGTGKKIKCSQCANLLLDMNISSDEYGLLDNQQKQELKNNISKAALNTKLNHAPISNETDLETDEKKSEKTRSSFFDITDNKEETNSKVKAIDFTGADEVLGEQNSAMKNREYVHFCMKCHKLDIREDENSNYLCSKCGISMVPLHKTADEWNNLSNDEMLGIVKNIQESRNNIEIKKPVFDEISISQPQNAIVKDKHISSPTRKKKPLVIVISIIIALVVLGLGVGGFLYFHDGKSREFRALLQNANDINKAIDYYNSNKTDNKFEKNAQKIIQDEYAKAVGSKDKAKHSAIANSGMVDDSFSEEIKNNSIARINKAKDDYFSAQIAMEDALAEVEEYTSYRNSEINKTAKNAKDAINGYKASQESYEAALADIQAQKYEDALTKLEKVIPEDPNYNDAQSKKDEILPKIKEDLLKEANDALKAKKYDNAIAIADRLSKYYTSDNDITVIKTKAQDGKKREAENKKRQEKESAKNNQQVVVVSTKCYDDGYYYVNMQADVIIQNKSNKVAADVSFGLLLFDGNGYPVRVDYSIYEGKYNNEFNCAFQSCNVQPGKKYGENKYYSVPSNCQKVKACVRDVTYLDGTVWNNPYYDYWLEENHSSY